MIAFNFQPMDNDKDEISIQNFVQNKADLVAGNDAGTADRIQVWDGAEFTTYFYRANKTTFPKWTLGPGWVNPTFQIIGKLEKFSDGNCGLSASFGNIAA